MNARHDFAGYGAKVVFGKFLVWAIAQRDFPMPEDVMTRFNCSRATAHRWLNDYEVVACTERPRRDTHGRLRAV